MLHQVLGRVSLVITLLLLSISLTAASSSPGSTIFPSFRVGSVIVTPTPSHPGFNPLTASNAALRANGYPERPHGTKPKWWIQAVSHAHWVYPRFTSHAHHQPGSPSAVKSTASNASGSDSSNWAGNIDNNGGHFTSIVAQWTVPSASSPCDTNVYSSIWPGIGSGQSSSSTLLQAGSEQDITWEYVQHYGYKSFPTYYLWWEAYPYNAQQQINIGVNPSNNIFVNVAYYGNNTAHYYVKNNTTGTTTSFNISFSGGFTGYNAEWITERTEENGSYPPLTNFSQMNFSDANAAQGSTWKGVGQWSHYFSVMQDPFNDDTEQVDAYPGAISGNGFPIYWSHYGDWDAQGT